MEESSATILSRLYSINHVAYTVLHAICTQTRYCIVYFYSAQHRIGITTRLKVLFDPFNLHEDSLFSVATDIPQTEKTRVSQLNIELHTSRSFISLTLGIRPNIKRTTILCGRATVYLPVPGIKPRCSVFLSKCITHIRQQWQISD